MINYVTFVVSSTEYIVYAHGNSQLCTATKMQTRHTFKTHNVQTLYALLCSAIIMDHHNFMYAMDCATFTHNHKHYASIVTKLQCNKSESYQIQKKHPFKSLSVGTISLLSELSK